MKALILAAGYGNRMRPFTESMHKTLLKIGDRTVIDRILDTLIVNDIEDIVIVTGYRASELKSHLDRTQPDLNITYVHNEQYRETNNIYSMALAFEQMALDDDLILIESDLIFHHSVLKRLLESKHANVALVDRYQSGMDGTVVTVDNEVVTNVIPPHLQPIGFDFSDKYKTLNIYKFSKEFCATDFKNILTHYARVVDSNCYYELVLGIVIYMQREVIHAAVLDGEQWAEVDDPNDLNLARFGFDISTQKSVLDKSFGGFWNYDILDFHFLRNMYFPTGAVLSELTNTFPQLVQNYGSNQQLLNQKLAYYLLCDPSKVVALNGASQVYPILQRYLFGKQALIPSPTFGEYTRCFNDYTTYDDDVGVNLEMIANQSIDADVVVIVNPNNPTGTLFPTDDIFTLAKTTPEKLFIIDESFIEFSGVASILSILKDEPLQNILVIKSLSKSLGVPGIRLGYVYSENADLIQEISTATPVWNMNSIAEHFLEIILKHRPAIEASFQKTIKDREGFATLLRNLDGVSEVFPSGGNFLLVELENDGLVASHIASRLLTDHKLYVKELSDRFSSGHGYFRLAVRLPEENARMIAALTEELVPESDFRGLSILDYSSTSLSSS